MARIALLTDFGLDDEYVGVMKGVIATIAPQAQVVDISHGIAPQNVAHGALVLAAAAGFFPPETIFVGVVDPGVGSRRRILALACGGQRFVVPDNGLIEGVLAQKSPQQVVAVENEALFLQPVSRTFHGRDIFAPVAAQLAGGLALKKLGPGVDAATIMDGVVPRCRLTEPGRVEGEVIAADRFGNLMTNIDVACLNALGAETEGGNLVVELAGKAIGMLVETYDQVPAHAPLALVGSRGLLEISVNCGNAQKVLQAADKEKVCVRLA